MPILTVVTNVPSDKVTSTTLTNAKELMSELFGVPENNVFVSIKAGVQMQWGPQTGLYALGTVQDTEPIQPEDTKKLAPAVFQFCEKYLGVPQNRMYVGFITLNPENIAYGGTLYANVMND